MFIFDMSNPLTLLLMLAVTVLLIFLSQEVKQSFIGAINVICLFNNISSPCCTNSNTIRRI